MHGKFIYWILEKQFSIWNTLGMTGSWSFEKGKHSRLKIEVDGVSVYFNDQRNFGTVKIVRGKEFLIDKLKSLGPDMLYEDVEDEVFIQRLRKKNHFNICKALMDQSVIAGVGNYIKADSLWLARLNPHLCVSEINDERLARLNESIKSVIRESFKSGGATIKSYKSLKGEIGEYSSRFLVYNRKIDPDGNEVVKDLTPDGRRTYWVPTAQR